MDQLPHLPRLLEVESVARPLHHHDVLASNPGEGLLVELGAVENLTLEGLGAVQHERGALEGRVQLGEAENVLLIFKNGLHVAHQTSISVEVEE